MAMKRTAKVSAHPTVWPEEIRAAHDAMCSAIVEARSAELKALKLCPRRCWEQTKNKQRVISANARQQAAQEAFKRCAKWATVERVVADMKAATAEHVALRDWLRGEITKVTSRKKVVRLRPR
jgi:hypothetical protein